MSETINIYCDESCHLEHDGQPLMVLGAVWCPVQRSRSIADRLREIKQAHGFPTTFEIKWTKVSPAKVTFYLDIVDYFFDESDLHFRALIAHDKARLRHDDFDQDHDTWYYKMFFTLLKTVLVSDGRYRVYLDYKDEQGAEKANRLHDVLANSLHDVRKEMVERVQLVRSHEVEQIQLTDLLTGIVSHANRGRFKSSAKSALIQRMSERSGHSLTESTTVSESKTNLFHWTPREIQG